MAPHGSLDPWALRHHHLRKWPWMRLVEGPLFQKAAAMHALTEAEARQMRDFGIPAPIVVSPNGVELSGNRACAGDDCCGNALKSDTFTFLFLSRLHPKKGLDVLARALARL